MDSSRRTRWFTTALVMLLVAIVAGFLFLRLLEATIARRFKTPQIAEPSHTRATVFADYDFPYESLDGRTHRLSELRGKVIFVNFWGTWCIRCVAEMPTIQKLYDSLESDPSVAFVIASRLDTPGRVRLYARYGHYDLPFYTVKDSAQQNLASVEALHKPRMVERRRCDTGHCCCLGLRLAHGTHNFVKGK